MLKSAEAWIDPVRSEVPQALPAVIEQPPIMSMKNFLPSRKTRSPGAIAKSCLLALGLILSSLQLAHAGFTNGFFENGAAGLPPQGWVVMPSLNATGFTSQTPQTMAGLNLAAGGVASTTIVSAATARSQPDAVLGLAASLRFPYAGNSSVNINGNTANQNVNRLSQTFTVLPGDIDAGDGLLHVRMAYAPVLVDPSHQLYQQPYYWIELFNVTTGTVLFTRFETAGSLSSRWKTVNGGAANAIVYTDWQHLDIAVPADQARQGDAIQLTILAASCQPGAHAGWVYADNVTTQRDGPSMRIAVPASSKAGGTVSYQYELAANNATGLNNMRVTIRPPTVPVSGSGVLPLTFSSMIAPPGFTCTQPLVGVTGNIVCTYAGLWPPAATVTMSVNWSVPANALTVAPGNRIAPGTPEIFVDATYFDTITSDTTEVQPDVQGVPPSIVAQPGNSSIAAGANTTFSVTAANATGYQWQVDQGGGFANLSNSTPYSGVTTSTLTITGATSSMNGYLYRAVVSGAVAPVAVSNTAALAVNSPPAVTGLSVLAGPVAGGTSVVIKGLNFTGASTVKFGSGNASSFTVDSDTQITAISPAGAAGTVGVMVTTPIGTSSVDASTQFTYVDALSISTASLGSLQVGAAYTLALAASGGVPPYTWSATDTGKPLPAGLSLSTDGVLSGTPTSAGSYISLVTVVDSSVAPKAAILGIAGTSVAKAAGAPVSQVFSGKVVDAEVVAATPVPALGQWVWMLLSIALAGFAAVGLRRVRVH